MCVPIFDSSNESEYEDNDGAERCTHAAPIPPSAVGIGSLASVANVGYRAIRGGSMVAILVVL